VAELRGTVVAEQGSTTDLQVTFTTTADGEYRARTATREAGDGRGTDNYWLDRGYATVTPVSGAINDTAAPRADLKRRLRRL
jgi:hypothetical protein